jgi:carboxyl-terminal processing protease
MRITAKVATMAFFRRFTILVFSAAMAACGGGGGGGGGAVPAACSVSAEKNFVRDATNEWYLFPELLPAQVNPSDFATAQDLLDFMTATARAQGKDRFFSYVTTKEADSSFLQEGQFIGFGFRVRLETEGGDRVYFLEAFENSPASDAGIGRGDELLAIDTGSGYVAVANILSSDPTLSVAFGPAEVGVQRGFRFAKAGTGTVVEATLTKRVVTIQPIPDDGARILTLPGNPGEEVGYVNLRTFISTADPALRDAFTQFQARNIRNVILDFRYNGGGLISIAELIGDLLGRLRQPDDVFSNIRFRTSKSSFDETRFFQPVAASVDAVNIAVITTGGTASASELVTNAMKPWARIAIIGSDTFGKPVGQSAFDLSDRCDLRLRLVTLRSTNADEEGDYYNGLASTMSSCRAVDDRTRPMGDPLEASTDKALNWLAGAACDPILAGAPGFQKPGLEGEALYPMPERPTPAQLYLPGVF